MVNLTRDEYGQPKKVDCVVEKFDDEAGSIPLFIEKFNKSGFLLEMALYSRCRR